MKILAIDIETSPLVTYTWGLWNQNIGISQIEQPSRMMCFAARWADAPKNSIQFFSEYHHDREVMVQAAWDLMDEADALLTYNGKKFDARHLNREFFSIGMAPPSPYKHIDLLTAARRAFYFPSNKLDYVSQFAGLAGKARHEGFGLWLACMEGDEDAWRRMEKYNAQDVHLLVDLYRKFIPWISGLPNAQLFGAVLGRCPKPLCGGELERRGTRTTGIGTYQRYRCKQCNGWSTDGKTIERVEIRGEG